MNLRLTLAVITGLVAAGVAAAAAEPPTVRIPRVGAPPTIDQYLDGAATPPGVRITGFVQRGPGEFEARAVTLGDEQGDLVQVLGGVRAGELVVTKGSFAHRSEMERHKIEPAL